jgi:cysteine synthase
MSILDSVGNTPLIKIEGIYVKCEFLNPSGSIKDRIAKYFVEKAEKKGLLKKGYKIVEASTGNTGTALSLVGAVKGYKVIIYIPKGLTEERYKMMKAFGAEVRFVPKDRMDIAVEKAKFLGKRRGYFHPNQFSNPWNSEEHEKYMGTEIIKQLKAMNIRKIDAVVAGIGSGGTIVGLSRAFVKINKNLKSYGVEPVNCALTYEHLHNMKKVCMPHMIEGIADGFVPPIVYKNIRLLDDVIKVDSKNSIKEAKRISKKHGMFVGVCSGANFLAAKKIKKQLKAKTVVTVFTDEGEKYLSEKWFSN